MKDHTNTITGFENLLNSIDEELKHSFGSTNNTEESPPAKCEAKETTKTISLHQNLKLQLNQNKTKATLIARPSTSSTAIHWKAHDIMVWLNEAGICYGIIERNIQKACSLLNENPQSQIEVVAAVGKEPIPGQPQEILYCVDRSSSAEKELYVRKNDLVLEVGQGSEGMPGMNIFGEEIQPENVNKPLYQAGENIRKAGNKYYSECFGLFSIQNNTLFVEKVNRDATCEINVSRDGMSVFMSVHPPLGDGKPVTYDGVLRLLEEYEIQNGIDLQKILDVAERANQKPVAAQEVLIASGTLPTKGKDGYVEWHIHPNKNIQRYVIDESGKIEFYDFHNLICVKSGDHLCTLHPPTKGRNGCNVYGHEISGQYGAPIPMKAGENIQLQKNQNEWYAGCDGRYSLENNRLEIQPVFHVDGDVDYKVGNIEFPGDVIVKGNVLDGIKIQTKGNITVYGTIEAAFVEAKGNVEVKKGIFGKEKGHVTAEKDIIASFLQNAFVHAKQNVIVSDQILNSQVAAYRSVEVKFGKGSIIGGTIYVGHELNAKTLGAKYGTKTTIEAGIDYQALQNIIDTHSKLERLKKHNEKLDTMIQQAKRELKDDPWNGAIQTMMNKGREKKEELEAAIAHFSSSMKEMRSRIYITNRPKITASAAVMPGVQIKIHDTRHNFHEPHKHCTITYNPDQKKILIGK